MAGVKIAFHSNQLSLRGTEVALYDYARYNEELLGNTSVIVSKAEDKNSSDLVVEKFNKRFKVFLYKDFSEVEKFLEDQGVDIFYAIKAGYQDGVFSSGRKTAVHAVFRHHDPHGDVYAYVSEWLGNKYKSPFVPHMITLPDVDGDLRQELGIPKDAIVFGRHGGAETFDIKWARRVVKRVLRKRDDIYFLFLFTNKFTDHKNVIHLPGNQDLEYKVKFINTCDAMLHARRVGETFGLAIGEFSIKNKPVFTYGGKTKEAAHLHMLGDKAITYNRWNLFKKIMEFKPDPSKDWNAYRAYNPETVMQQFKKVFIDG